MCIFDQHVHDCVCDELVVPQDPKRQCRSAVITSSRRYCKAFPNPQETNTGVQIHSERVYHEGCCGKDGCLRGTADAFMKTAKNNLKDYIACGVKYFNLPDAMLENPAQGQQEQTIQWGYCVAAYGHFRGEHLCSIAVLGKGEDQRFPTGMFVGANKGLRDAVVTPRYELGIIKKHGKVLKDGYGHIVADQLIRIGKRLDKAQGILQNIDRYVSNPWGLPDPLEDQEMQDGDEMDDEKVDQEEEQEETEQEEAMRKIVLLLDAARVSAAAEWVADLPSTKEAIGKGATLKECCLKIFKGTRLTEQMAQLKDNVFSYEQGPAKTIGTKDSLQKLAARYPSPDSYATISDEEI